MKQLIAMPHDQVLPFLFTPEGERRPEDVAAWQEALRQADAEQGQQQPARPKPQTGPDPIEETGD